MLDQSGAVAAKLPRFEPRPQQVAMARAVAEALEHKHHLLVEAGTGVGKSFAYLLPAIERAIHHDERIVISTHTIALQEQLVQKDIPFLQTVIDEPFAAELVKGRSNYLGLRRLKRTSERQDRLLPAVAQRQELWLIEDWAYETTDGSLADLPASPHPGLWERVKSDANDCMGRKCPHYKPCFYQRARRRAEAAQLLVVNHALFLSDLALRRRGVSLLPDYHAVILDEAHTFESAASDHFGEAVSNAQVRFLLNALYNPRTNRGTLTLLLLADTAEIVRQTHQLAEAYFDDLQGWMRTRGRSNGRLVRPPDVPNALSPALIELAARLESAKTAITKEGDQFELGAAAQRCKELAASLTKLHDQRQADWVYWCEVGADRPPRVTLRGQPIDLGPVLKAALFDSVRAVIMTSATLQTQAAGGFEHIKRRLGLDAAQDGRIRTEALGSPFDYRRQATIHVEAAMPDPADAATYLPAAAQRVRRYLAETGGRAFVLFTSYDALNRTAEALRGYCADHDMPLLVQGAGLPRSKMLEQFRSTPRSVLMGTSSFWEGVDVPGEALSNVIIVKLPFVAPDQPVVEARIEQIRKRGGNPFMDYQVPEAVLKFRQAFGRLIRTRDDTGIVVVLDPRVVTRPYGRRFLEALPECNVVVHRDGPSI